MLSMREPFARAVAGLALVSLLACSGLGLCWKQFASRGHDCCEPETASPAKPCASAVEQGTPLKVLPPAVTVLPVGEASVAAATESMPFAFALVLAPKAPPLILRI